ncbi:bifunctional demethylmenaquinone methyltransferase/2-methoxy-6-polyprenyl-1,4-benzoquinol methylase UbiE [filamentous cyanobacterium LEGE 11480]|uniref:2-phytyl-1,4-naphtoquinone methyltransferase n=1 Tax=Romeriopsis navalis LEGE 11480 TaxID=2777977 RepID=A0A928VN15_9CYAN|nr:bifunctional demethylmenaquinone methyltransferase/2-methoxy-6-polyprenyl-1,4-benzoquinol methylase UbiE [Romeriopsis navalis]MBE9031551.1 bifunctional demethylmenaquinone methyltransferase/2-methoxy-6-polyprenyl-1,4-benzoquinol methylase UbiE [Romeriopsis navalis LEGE 11480]
MSQTSAESVQALFDRIAPVYDELNQTLSLGQHKIWKQMAVKWVGLKPGDQALDICCGSGDVAMLLAQKVGAQGRVCGVDFAAQQLEVAAARQVYELNPETTAPIDWMQGDALALPVSDNQFDGVTMSYGLRNVMDIPQALQEIRRVLKPEAKAAILDMHRPKNPWVRGFQQWYLDNVVVPAAKRKGVTSEYEYIAPSLDRFPTGEAQERLALAAEFSTAVHYPIAEGTMGVLVMTK